MMNFATECTQMAHQDPIPAREEGGSSRRDWNKIMRSCFAVFRIPSFREVGPYEIVWIEGVFGRSFSAFEIPHLTTFFIWFGSANRPRGDLGIDWYG